MNLFEVYPIYDVQPVKAEGCYFTDIAGNRYLDFYGGHAVISIGHSHPHYLKRLQDQLQNIGYYSNSVVNPLQDQLADLLGTISEYKDYKLFLVNSGAEANENALKLASFAFQKRGVIAFEKGFHGRTSGALAVTDNPKLKAPINHHQQVNILPLEDLEQVEKVLEQSQTCAVIIEGIQGIAGINVPSGNFLQGLRQLCNKYHCALILDEIQSGYGRSGKFFAHQYANIQPDLITVAKGMGNGFPVGGVLINPVYQASYGQLGTTFGGNHLACCAGLAVLEVIRDEGLLERSLNIGQMLLDQLTGIEQIRETRGKGLMLGIKFDFDTKKLRKHLLLHEHIFVGASSDPQVVRLLPPLCIGENEVHQFVEGLNNSLKHEELLIH